MDPHEHAFGTDELLGKARWNGSSAIINNLLACIYFGSDLTALP
jgi:hypothetical protein